MYPQVISSFTVFTSLLVTASNGGCSRNVPMPQSHHCSTTNCYSHYQRQSYLTTDGQSVNLFCSQVTICYSRPMFLYLSQELSSAICRVFSMEHPLWREDGSVICSYECYWGLPAQSLSGPSPAELETLSYRLIWDWVPFVTTYVPQNYGRGILTRFNAGVIFIIAAAPRYIALERTSWKRSLLEFLLLFLSQQVYMPPYLFLSLCKSLKKR
jgi:hypothetical protein